MELEVLKEEGLTKVRFLTFPDLKLDLQSSAVFDAEKSHLFDQDTERLLSPQQDCGDAVIQMMKVISKIQSALKIFQS